MTVVVSHSQNEIEDQKEKGVDIVPNRARMVREDLATKFKDADDQLRLVFVCTIWLTGFDALACSTIYLYKPMKNHTPMQTIARGKRVFGEKNDGLIVDYYGVFKDLQRALAIYAPVAAGYDSTPIKNKEQLIALLNQVLAETHSFCEAHRIDVPAILNARDLQKLRLLDDAVAAIIVNDTAKQTYQELALDIKRLFKAIKPDPVANELITQCMLHLVLSAKIRELNPTLDISKVISKIDQLLDRSIAAEGYIIRPPELLDLSQLDLDKLRQ